MKKKNNKNKKWGYDALVVALPYIKPKNNNNNNNFLSIYLFFSISFKSLKERAKGFH